VLSQTGKDSGNLGGCLPLPKDDLRHAGAECTMVIDFSESEVFERKMAQAFDSIVGREIPAADVIEKFADGVGVQEETCK